MNISDSIDVLKKFRFQSYYVLNSISSKLNKKASGLIPILSTIEEGGIFVNYNGFPQIATLFHIKLKQIKPLFKFLKRFFFLFLKFRKNVNSFFNFNTYIIHKNAKTVFYNFMYELTKKPDLLKKNLKYVSINSINKTLFFKKQIFINNYPVKSIVEDFFRTNNMLKNSRTMLNCSRDFRKLEYNFIS